MSEELRADMISFYANVDWCPVPGKKYKEFTREVVVENGSFWGLSEVEAMECHGSSHLLECPVFPFLLWQKTQNNYWLIFFGGIAH